LSEHNPFRPGFVIGLVAAGLVSFAAFVMLLGWGGSGAGRNAGRGTAASVAGIGFKGLVDLTDQYYQVRLIRDPADLDSEELVVVALEPVNEHKEVRDLLRRRTGQPTLLILPKWTVAPDPFQRGWVRALGPGQSQAASSLMGPDRSVEQLSASEAGGLRDRVMSVDLMEGVGVELPRAPQVLHGDDVEMLVGVPGEGALVARIGDEPHYVIADPDLVNNHGLARPANARAALEMLARMSPGKNEMIRFDVTVNGLGAGRSLLRSMLEPPFLALTLALLVAALLAGLHGAVRFGAPRRPVRAIPFGKAALVENSAGLVRLARREVSLGGGYADVVRDEAARAGAAPAHLRERELDAYLDRFNPAGEAPFSTLADRVRMARDKGELMAAARALFRWKKDMIR
jgi:hypothetical protein